MVSLKRHSQQPLAVNLSGMEQGRKRKSDHDVQGTVVKRPMLVTASLVDPMLAESPRVGLISLKELETAGIARFPELSFVWGNINEDAILTFSRQDMYNHPPLGAVSRVSIVINENGGYDFRVLMFVKETGTINSVNQFLELCQVAVDSAYKFCPGINHDTYKQYQVILRYDPKGLRHTLHPVQRIDS